MWPGPVFHAELVALARQGRFYAARLAYGGLLLLLVIAVFGSYEADLPDGAEPTLDQVAEIGARIFVSFAVFQGLVALILTAPLVAGAIAEERERKTLHYLMATPLSGAEIVLGKVAARLLRLGVVFLIGLPILGLITLCGGVDPALLVSIVAATATTAFCIAGFSILASVHANRPRDAVALAFSYELIWLIIPSALLVVLGRWLSPWPPFEEFGLPLLEWAAGSSPGDLLRGGAMAVFFSPYALLPRVYRMMGLQVVLGSACIALAAWRLRPAFRNFDSPGIWGWFVGNRPAPGPKRRGTRDRPAVWDRAMLWKETCPPPPSPTRRVLVGGVGLALVGLVAFAGWDHVRGAADELRRQPFWYYGHYRHEINGFLRGINAICLVLGLASVASAAATSITAEREADTWTTLATSPVEGSEVIGGKILGALWQARAAGWVLLASWAGGLAIGSVHPIGALLCLVELVVFGWSAAAIGVTASLRSRSSLRATTATLAVLAFSNVGYLILFAPFGEVDQLLTFGCTPFLFASSLFGPNEPLKSPSGPVEVLPPIIMGTILYAVAALIVTRLAIGGYDRAVDRPNKRRPERTAATLRAVFAGRPARPG